LNAIILLLGLLYDFLSVRLMT